MGKRITRAADLPDWFKASKYDKAVQLDARGWLKQLEFRQLCHNLVSDSAPEELENREPYGFKLVEFLSAIRTNPIFSADDSRFEQLIYDGIGDENYPIGQRAYPPGFLGITAYDIGDIILEWDSERQKEFMHWLEFRRARDTNRGKTYPRRTKIQWVFQPLETDHMKPVRVAAMYPDHVLRQSFEIFVSNEREKLDPHFLGKTKRSNTFLEWCNCGLLQYIDLTIWSTQSNTRITNKAFAQGIFPKNYEKGEENIRTTTQKHASIILGKRVKRGFSMSDLWAYARLEEFLENQDKD